MQLYIQLQGVLACSSNINISWGTLQSCPWMFLNIWWVFHRSSKFWSFLVFCLTFFFLFRSLFSQTLSFWSLRTSSSGKYSILHNFISFFFLFLSRSKSIFYTSFLGVTQLQVKRKRVTTLNLHSKFHIRFTQDNSAALKMRCSMWMLLKTCCMSIWLSERFKKQYPGTVLVQ